MSLEFKLTICEVLTFIGTALVLIGLLKEYGLEGLLEVVSVWKERDFASRIKVESWSERVGSLFVLLGIAVELLGSVGVFKISLRIETQHRREIARVTAHISGLLSFEEINALSGCLKKAFPKGNVIVTGGALDNRASALAGQLRLLLSFAGYTVRPPKGNTIFRLGYGTVVAVAQNASPVPLRIQGLAKAFACINWPLPVGSASANNVNWLSADDVLLVVNAGPP